MFVGVANIQKSIVQYSIPVILSSNDSIPVVHYISKFTFPIQSALLSSFIHGMMDNHSLSTADEQMINEPIVLYIFLLCVYNTGTGTQNFVLRVYW